MANHRTHPAARVDPHAKRALQAALDYTSPSATRRTHRAPPWRIASLIV
jgi:hypothetical protein